MKLSTYLQDEGSDGKIVEHRPIRDDLKFMMQLGLAKGTSNDYDRFLRAWKDIEQP